MTTSARPTPDSVLQSGPPAVLVVAAREDLVIGTEVAALIEDEPPADM